MNNSSNVSGLASKISKEVARINSKDKLPDFVIRRLDIPLISYVNITKNRTLYSRETLESGLNNPRTKDLIEGKKFYSEADHPNPDLEQRLKTRLNSPIVGNIHDLEFNEDDQHLWGTIDIFDNEIGNLIVNLLDYGSQLGISIRAEGDTRKVVDSNGEPYQVVIPDKFIIHGFDVVISPSSADAIIDNGNQLTESVLDDTTRRFLSESSNTTLTRLLSDISDYDYDSLAPTISLNSSRSKNSSNNLSSREQSVAHEMKRLYESFGSGEEVASEQLRAAPNEPQYPGSPRATDSSDNYYDDEAHDELDDYLDPIILDGPEDQVVISKSDDSLDELDDDLEDEDLITPGVMDSNCTNSTSTLEDIITMLLKLLNLDMSEFNNDYELLADVLLDLIEEEDQTLMPDDGTDGLLEDRSVSRKRYRLVTKSISSNSAKLKDDFFSSAGFRIFD